MLPAGTFDGTTVAVTGGGTGLGRAIAVEFGRLGAAVAVVSRDADHRANGVKAVEEAGGTAAGFACDVRDADAVAAAFDAIDAELGPATVLVNNAAGNFPAKAEALSIRAWRAVTQIVLDGTFLCSTELARRLIARGEPGAVLNIGATYAWTGGPGAAHSAAAKAGVGSLTQSLAVEWAPHGIRVNCLTPGPSLTPTCPRQALQAVSPPPSPSRPAGSACPTSWAGQAAHTCARRTRPTLTADTPVLDGANWLRRGLQMPVFTPVEEQL